MVYNNKKHRERGGIGRHNRLKICRLRGVGVQVPPLVPNEVTPLVAGGLETAGEWAVARHRTMKWLKKLAKNKE